MGWTEILLRSFGIFILAFGLVRMMGKRNLARMTPFGFVTYVVIAVLAAILALGIIENYYLGLLVLGVWVLVPIALDYLALKSKRVHDWVNGKETVLIKHGKIMEENLMQERFSGEELLRELRKKNVFNLTDVEFAVMEADGSLDVLLKSDKQPITAHDLEQKVSPRAEPQTVILDGNIMDEPLASLGLNRQWLETEIAKAGVAVANVFVGQVDSSGDLYLDLFDDALQIPQPKVKERVYANLEKCHADLTTFALETKNQAAKAMYGSNAEKLRNMQQKLRPYLLR